MFQNVVVFQYVLKNYLLCLLQYHGFQIYVSSITNYFIVFQVGSYGGKLKYTISYVAGPRGTQLEDADVQIIVSTSLS